MSTTEPRAASHRRSDLPLSGQVAVVTGASRGIGRAIAVALGHAGADLALIGRDEPALRETEHVLAGSPGRTLPLIVNVTSAEAVGDMVTTVLRDLGDVGILVNNAGVHAATPLLSATADEWNAMFAGNLTSTFFCMQAVGRHFAARGGGKIVNLSSNWAVKAVSGYAAYAAAKNGVIALTRTAAVEWARYNVQVNAIAPGYVDTAMSDGLNDDPEIRAHILKGIPARRIGHPEEVADLVLYLVSPSSDYVTGQTVFIDGGSSAR